MENIFTDSQIHGNSLIRSLLICLFMLSVLLVTGQTASKRTLKQVEKAKELIKGREFHKARSILAGAIDESPGYPKSYEHLFTVLKILGKEREVHNYQLRYVKDVASDQVDQRVWQSLASYEFRKGAYSEAFDFLKNSNNPDSILSSSIQFALEQSDRDSTFVMSELPKEVNRFQFQYLPVLTIDGRTLIYTGRKDEHSDEDIFISQFDGENWTEGESISNVINSPYNEGACSISADGRILVLTACEGRQTVGNCDLYISTKQGEEWSKLKNLGKTVNSRFWDSQPSLSADGKTLFFVSRRPGGEGGRDIWMSRFVNEKWTEPENLGAPINTKRDETTPFIHVDDSTLFFSSNGHVGMGGYDLYKSVRDEKGWTTPQNLGYPLNTFHDEVSLFASSDGHEIFFTKERLENSKIVWSKIIRHHLSEDERYVPMVNYLTGNVYEFGTDKPVNAELKIIDLNRREASYLTESDPVTGRYFAVLPNGTDYGIFIEKQGYLFEEVSFETTISGKTDTLDFFLKPIASGASIVLRNIYFEFDSDQLQKKSFESIERVIELMRTNPKIRIEISGHTDNVGSPEYNLDLSKRRARTVYEEIVSRGIDLWRVSYKGLGQTQPLNENVSESEKSQNRRIEFRIL